MRLVFALVFAVVLAGCYSREERAKERLYVKIEAFESSNGRSPNADELSTLKAEAENEEIDARRIELEGAAKDAVAAGGAAASGNFIVAGLLGVGALLTLLGLNRGKKTVPPEAAAIASAAIAEVKKEG
jgi:hypothetical protein